jgi:hypothetical protein
MSASRELSGSPISAPAKRQKLEDQVVSKPAPPTKKKKKRKVPPIQEGSGDDVLLREVQTLLGEAAIEAAVSEEVDYVSPVQSGDTLELEVGSMSSTGKTRQAASRTT